MSIAAPTNIALDDTSRPMWLTRTVALASARGRFVLNTDSYVCLVWTHTQRRAGQLSVTQQRALIDLDAPLREVVEGPWERRYRQIALRDLSGLALAGRWRTQWLTRQRRARAAGTLDRGKVVLLDRLQGFTWSPGDAQWETTYAKIKRFADAHGRIPTRADDARMSNWLATQRFALRADRLRFDRVQALTALPGWSAGLSSTRSRPQWERRCEQLRLFLERVGRYPQSEATDPAEAALAHWVTAQREQVRRDGLAPYRIAALTALPGWRWAARDAAWDQRYVQLCADLHRGATLDPTHSLYPWVVAQRRRHRAGRLRPEQERALRDLGLLDARLAPVA